ncbi:MAG: ectoine/hydroxyectoine ABC transporter permease subunit EhuD [Arenicellales bacterium]|jgi:polar amino acid transport system permease protein|nr:ectoine/hydroxyectoine ABC transporter permease subunit EhuD [Pseudomonadales bacterium]MDP7452789.1 ectoine/hydroxyectoine ABC transporter permease subunit EhuD [Arenicellales bacterium]|tara:strand:+ start:5372 stop:6043 length:672 start_codon:yes stop_codon:yes gene_type:complete
MFEWKWEFTLEILPRLLQATLNTLMAAGSGYAIALILGLVFVLGQRTSSPILTGVIREIVEFIRSTPLVLQIFFLFYVGPQFGIVLPPWASGLIAIGLHYGSYLSEVYRAGLDGVPRGQWEACRALNLSASRTYFRIIIPQALPLSLPGMGNYLVGIFKDTPMLSVIGVMELMATANALGSETYRYLEPYTMVGFIFLAISLPSAFGLRRLEAWVKIKSGIEK